VDLYHGNGEFDAAFFGQYDFAILQAHSGYQPAGGWYTRTAQAVRQAGKRLGAYLFLVSDQPAQLQAQQFLNQAGTVPPDWQFVDYETGGNGVLPTQGQLQLCLSYLPGAGIYSNGSQLPMGPMFDARVWWAAGYPNVVPVPRPFVLHQYSDSPHDMNVVVDEAWYHGSVPLPPAPPKRHKEPSMPARVHYQSGSHVFDADEKAVLAHIFWTGTAWSHPEDINAIGGHPEYRLDPNAAIWAGTKVDDATENDIDVYWRGAGGETGHTWYGGGKWGAELLG